MCKFLLLILLFKLCMASNNGYEELINGYIEEDGYGGKGDGKYYGGSRWYEEDGICDKKGNCNYFDNERNLYEPCDYPDDVDCVRQFFGKYGQCKVVYNEDNKPVYREKHTTYFPKINLTLITTRSQMRNLNGTIERFYINKKTGNLIMAVDLTVDFYTKLGIFIVSRRGREPAIAKDEANGTYPLVLTAVIPIKEGLTLKALRESSVTAFHPSPIVRFYIGPKVALNKDPAIAAAVVGLLADIPTALLEIYLSEAPNFFLAYLQKYICDFGIPLSDSNDIQAILL